MHLPKETIPGALAFTTNNEVYLESSHICIRKNTAEKIFGNALVLLSVFYAKDNTFWAAPAEEELFKSIHKANQQMLKNKNSMGDKSISIQEILLDNDIDGQNRNLEFTIEEALRIIKIKL